MSHDNKFVVVLDQVKDFGNIGTIIRTSHAFGVSRVILTSQKSDLFIKKTIDASRGKVFSTECIQFESETSTIDYLRNNGYQIVVTSPRGDTLQSLLELPPNPVALIVGNESDGVGSQFIQEADFLIQIPMSSEIESLNVGVATGISIYEIRLKQIMATIEKQIKSTLGRDMNVAAMLVQKALDVELGKVSELSSKQVVFMMVLKCDQEMVIKDVCVQFGILPEDIPDFLGPLKQKELVIQRDQTLNITSLGVDLLGKLWFTIENTEAKILAEFSEDEVRKLRELIKKVQSGCIRLLEASEDPE
jgi:TrmH family RNA methyltransferase